MMPSFRRFSPLFLLPLALALVVPAAVEAQPARIAVTVLDPDGKPLPGVDILVTTADRGDVKVEATTNPKGKATVMVPSVTLNYDMALEREGYQSLTVDVKPQFGETTFREFTLAPVGAVAAAPAPAAAASAPSFTPAQLAFNAGVEALGKQDSD
ncbi:MAG TPA: carboxypeptidase-like regulatory domain-containing protein, partial [Thermoanaerobaculia bacterium]|nr:carboxypeptidase-like regulatory domain-containing protein [Thermoanaerobaculia bacterium]